MVYSHFFSTISIWKQRGLKETNERMEEIYWIRECSLNCEKCGKEFKNSRDRHMDHDHKTGKFRNILCNLCNIKRCEISKNNTTGHLNIYKRYSNRYKQGYIWIFYITKNYKHVNIKSLVDKEKLIKFAENWKKENKYSD